MCLRSSEIPIYLHCMSLCKCVRVCDAVFVYGCVCVWVGVFVFMTAVCSGCEHTA